MKQFLLSLCFSLLMIAPAIGQPPPGGGGGLSPTTGLGWTVDPNIDHDDCLGEITGNWDDNEVHPHLSVVNLKRFKFPLNITYPNVGPADPATIPELKIMMHWGHGAGQSGSVIQTVDFPASLLHQNLTVEKIVDFDFVDLPTTIKPPGGAFHTRHIYVAFSICFEVGGGQVVHPPFAYFVVEKEPTAGQVDVFPETDWIFNN